MYFLYKIIIKVLRELHLLFILDDKKYLKMSYYIFMKEKLNINNPETFNEKLQWLKLYDRNPEYTKMVDKYDVKEYVSNIVGKEYVIQTLDLYDKFDNKKKKKMPNKFVLKCTHDSGSTIVCENKSYFNKKEVRKKIRKALRENYFYSCREWPYKNVKPRILIEKFMGNRLNDYKLFCFNGKVETILVCSNREGVFKNTDFYDKNWKLMPFTRENHENNPEGIKKPEKLEEMIRIAEKLSSNIPFVRVDLYEINKKIYFGELTFYPSGGFEGFKPREWDKKLGDKLQLPQEKVFNNEK